jgi:hypothetical protein
MRWFISVIAIVLLWSPASAQDVGSPETLRAANELAAVMSREMMNQMSRDITAQLWPKLEKDIESRVDKATLSELRTEFERLLAKFADEALKEAPKIYARYFDAQELRDITAFYRTSTGRKALQVMPKIMAEYAEYNASSLMARMQDFQREIQAASETVLRKHGYKK